MKLTIDLPQASDAPLCAPTIPHVWSPVAAGGGGCSPSGVSTEALEAGRRREEADRAYFGAQRETDARRVASIEAARLADGLVRNSNTDKTPAQATTELLVAARRIREFLLETSW